MKYFLSSIIAVILMASVPANATIRLTTDGNVTDTIVIEPMIFIRGSSEDASKSRDILNSHPLLKDAAIYKRVKNYLESTLNQEVRDNIKFYRWLHTDSSRKPVDETTLIIEVDYMVRSVKIDGKDISMGSITFKPKYPLNSKSSAETFYKIGSRWQPQIIFPISDNPKELDKQLDQAVADLFGNYGASIVWVPANQKKGDQK